VGDGPGHKKELVPKKKQLFGMETYIEDAKQEEKEPDLLEAMMRPTCLVKEELRQICSN